MEGTSERQEYRQQKVQVEFDAVTKEFHFSGDIEGDDIRLHFGLNVIRFPLVTVPQGFPKAEYAATPIVWNAESEPFNDPRVLPEQLDLWIENANLTKQAKDYPFELTVTYEGQRYTSTDPTIINEPREGKPFHPPHPPHHHHHHHRPRGVAADPTVRKAVTEPVVTETATAQAEAGW